jgi:hypothetical protein
LHLVQVHLHQVQVQGTGCMISKDALQKCKNCNGTWTYQIYWRRPVAKEDACSIPWLVSPKWSNTFQHSICTVTPETTSGQNIQELCVKLSEWCKILEYTGQFEPRLVLHMAKNLLLTKGDPLYHFRLTVFIGNLEAKLREAAH